MNTVLAQTPHLPKSSPVNQLIHQLQSPSGLMLLGCLGFIVALQWLSRSGKKGKLATGYWGGTREKARAARVAKKQMQQVTRNNVTLYIGTPPHMRKRLRQDWEAAELLKKQSRWERLLENTITANPTLYVPDAQRGIAAIGAAGSGKTFSVIDPLIRSALDQGFPACLYDFKYPAQTKRAVAYAMKRGYVVRVFAPGFQESETCNPLDLIRDEEDAVGAGQLAQVISKNFERNANASSDKFFEDAGDTLVEGILLVTKAVKTLTSTHEYCDLMMASAILNLPGLAYRMELASNTKLPVWTSRPLQQLISVKDSEKTVSGIVGTAQKIFQKFLKKDFIGAFCGKTTLPLDLDGKQLVIFGLDRNNRDIVGPLLAAILHMIVSRNVSRTIPRKDPLVVALDELPTLYLPALVNWLNENREDGFCGILGYQNVSQLEKAYGKELSRAIVGGTGSKFIFNPQDPESSKLFSDYLGEMEVEFNSKSRSMGRGGGSRSVNENIQKRPLLEAAQFAKLKTGKAVIINPAYTRGDEAYVPLFRSVKVPPDDIAEMKWSEQKWDLIQNQLRQRSLVISDEERREQFNIRRALAEELFPLPENLKNKADSIPGDLAEIF